MSIQGEAITILSMLFMGVVMGISFDSYQILKQKSGIKGFLTAVCDLLYWISFTFLAFGTLFRLNGGIVRFYIFIVILTGFFMYVWLFRSAYMNFFLRLLSFVIKLYQFVRRLIDVLLITPVKFLLQMLLVSGAFLVQLLYRFLIGAGRVILFLVAPFRRLIRSRFRGRGKVAGFFLRMTKWFRNRKSLY
ncbi:MAG: spore cortex biosynthesis protein YabQ [Bacillaceae bacterium]|nr:spore cortex biosynthesis protein YabQ [Bacillaceae bacterium]